MLHGATRPGRIAGLTRRVRPVCRSLLGSPRSLINEFGHSPVPILLIRNAVIGLPTRQLHLFLGVYTYAKRLKFEPSDNKRSGTETPLMLVNVYRKAHAIWDTPVRWFVVIASLFLVIAVVIDTINLEQVYKAMQAWTTGKHDLSIIAFTLGCAILMSAIIPEVILGVAAGNLFGFVWGSISFCVSGLLCSLLVFFIARTCLQSRVQSVISGYPRLRAIEGVVSNGRLRLLCLLRLLPLNPALMSYALATTKVKLWPYLLASMCMIPGWVLTVYFGHVTANVTKLAGGASVYMPLRDTLTIGGLLLSIAVMVYITRVAARHCGTYDESQ